MSEVIRVDFVNREIIQPESDSNYTEIPLMIRAAAEAIASRGSDSKLAKEAFSWLTDDEITLAMSLAKGEPPEAS